MASGPAHRDKTSWISNNGSVGVFTFGLLPGISVAAPAPAHDIFGANGLGSVIRMAQMSNGLRNCVASLTLRFNSITQTDIVTYQRCEYPNITILTNIRNFTPTSAFCILQAL